MPKSRLRGGAKQHRKRITARNNNFKGMWNRLQKQAWEKHEQWKLEQQELNDKDTNDQSISGPVING
jgi:hypothetical protein